MRADQKVPYKSKSNELGQIVSTDNKVTIQQSTFQKACSATPETFTQMHPELTNTAPSKFRKHDMNWSSSIPCLEVSSVDASSFIKRNDPKNTLDRDLRSRWSPLTSGSQWIQYDLGRQRLISALSLVLFTRGQSTVSIQISVSSDGKSFSKVNSGEFSGQGTNTLLRTFDQTTGRYVRITVSPVSGDTRPSLYEAGIHENTLTASK